MTNLDEDVRALSVRQPWASLLVAGVKDTENRTWHTHYRGRLYIHAGKTVEHEALPVARKYRILSRDLGAFLGTIQLDDVHHADECGGHCSPWADPGGWHWRMSEPQRWVESVPGTGRLGLFTPPDAVTVGRGT